MGESKTRRNIFMTIAASVAVLALLLFRFGPMLTSQPTDAENNQDTQLVGSLVGAEELMLVLNDKLKVLSKSVRNLEFPDLDARELLSQNVDITGDIEIVTDPLNVAVASDSQQVAIGDVSLWQAYFDKIDYFENGKFYFVSGDFTDNKKDVFRSEVGFNGSASYSGGICSLHAELTVDWFKDASQVWKIQRLKHNDASLLKTSKRFFQNVTDRIGLPKQITDRINHSTHAQLISHLVNGGDYFLPPGVTYPFFFPDVTLEHPAVSIVDIDNDGLEDCYCSMQYGPNLLLRNKGDGTFAEVAKQYNLAIEGDTTCAVFADFDNDGDPDLMLGRARHRAMYLINEDGWFFNASSSLPKNCLPALVSSISVVDYNQDGLLDAHFSTYSPIESAAFTKTETPMWVQHFLTPDQALKYEEQSSNRHGFLSRTGPPNVLLQNKGEGEFAVAPESESLQLWQMTFQSTWSDIDSDGDPDLYVANDFGPDHVLRNDQDNGFVDMTKELGLTAMGFTMGVSFGDYDNDGQSDIYVTNMYSKAGRRITRQFDGLDPRFKEMASGNFLYHRAGDKFELVSHHPETPFQVAKAGWAWGGQFIDFNNDSFRDLYSSSGYYTAPKDIAVDLDL